MPLIAEAFCFENSNKEGKREKRQSKNAITRFVLATENIFDLPTRMRYARIMIKLKER
jgi:hypothetical protein